MERQKGPAQLQPTRVGGFTSKNWVSTKKNGELDGILRATKLKSFELKSGWCLTYPSEKYEFVSWDDDIPNIWKVRIQSCSKPPTRSGFFVTIQLGSIANFRDLWVVADMNFRFWHLSWQVWHIRESYPKCMHIGAVKKNASKPISVNASTSARSLDFPPLRPDIPNPGQHFHIWNITTTIALLVTDVGIAVKTASIDHHHECFHARYVVATCHDI